MNFTKFMEVFSKNAKSVFDNSQSLFLANVDKDILWETYIESYPADKNPLYRTRREYDCSCCKNFIRHFGNVVGIGSNNEIITFWDFHTEDDTFEPVLQAMSKLVKNSVVSDVFVTKQSLYGTPVTREYLESKLVQSWSHFYVELPKTFVSKSGLAVNEIASTQRDVKNVFKRSLEEITPDSIQTVLDLIAENSLYRGEEWQGVLNKFADLQKKYKKLKTVKDKENYCWVKSVEVGGSVGKIRNHSIGTLLTDISNGVEIEEAVGRYEKIMAGDNYKRPKAIHTKKQVEDAEKFVIENGLINSLGRRHSKISDITINNVIWANRDAKKAMKSKGVFESLKEDVSVNPKTFENIKGIKIEDFITKMNEVKSFEILLENRHTGNLFSLISPENKESPSLFKWDNGFSWSYNGNIADSMKERVKSAGGKVDGILRFSLQWNVGGNNLNDYDAHCVEPNGNEIYFSSKGRVHPSTGILDVDIINPVRNQVAVENITWSDRKRMQVGKYVFFIHNYSHRGGLDGFDAELEFDGQLYEFSYHNNLGQSDKIIVAEVTLDRNGNFTVSKSLPSSVSSKDEWGLKTNQFVPVGVTMFSPNFWDGQTGIGNKHYFFILSGCKNETNPNGFYNEFLKEDFTKHRKVFEALGSKMRVESSDEQLSGLGFSSTKQDYIIAKVDGKITKIIF